MRWQVVVIPRKHVQLAMTGLALAVLVWGGSRFVDLAARRLTGVAPGVTFMGKAVGGMTPKEARAFLEANASLWEVAPVNADYEPGAKKVQAGRSGMALALEPTLKRLLEAPAGANIEPVLLVVAPEVKAEFYTPVYGVRTEKPLLSLTINVDWGEKELPQVLAKLRETGVKATFFLTGTFAERFPELVRQVAEEGHEIANHGRRHVHPTTLSHAQIQDLLRSNEAILARAAGRQPSRLFAPPYGEVNREVAAAAAQSGYRTIMWSADTIDWQKPAPAVIVARVLKKARPGGIILMHPTAPTAQALPELIRRLRSQGYQLVTVSQLLRAGPPLDPNALP